MAAAVQRSFSSNLALVQSLKCQLADRDRKITGLKRSLELSEGEKQEYRRRSEAEKQGLLAELRFQREESLAETRRVTATWNQELQSMIRSGDELKREVGELRIDRARQDTRIIGLERQVFDLKLELARRDVEIDGLKEQLGAKGSEITTLKEELAAKGSEITTLKEELAAKGSEITSLKEELRQGLEVRDKMMAEFGKRLEGIERERKQEVAELHQVVIDAYEELLQKAEESERLQGEKQMLEELDQQRVARTQHQDAVTEHIFKLLGVAPPEWVKPGASS